MQTRTEKLSVPEMHCGHCVSSVSRALEGLGLEGSRVDLDSRTVEVTFRVDKTSLDHIVAAIEDQGYDVATPDGS